MDARPREKGQKKHPILVCLAGFSPAVVTETLYALAVLRGPKIVPERICILTTEDAYPAVVSALLGRGGAIRRLASEYRLPERSLQCSPEDVVVLRSRGGKPLSDIRSSADSRDAGEAIAAVLADLQADPDAELHCSLAGGRKTMGALLALALQISARPGDRLYHVLVSEPFEKIQEFFYPPRRPAIHEIDGKRVDLRNARIDLAEIPIVRMGTVAEALGIGAGELTVRAAQIEAAMLGRIRHLRMDLEPSTCVIRLDGTQLRLQPQQFSLFALYAWLRRTCNSCRRAGSVCDRCHPTDDDVFDRHRERLLRMRGLRRGQAGSRFIQVMSDRSGTAESREEFGAWLRQTRSKVNRCLRRSPNLTLPGLLLITRSNIAGGTGQRGHGLRIAPSSIAIGNVEKIDGNVDLMQVRERGS